MGNTAVAEAKYEEASRMQKALLLGQDGGADSASVEQESGRAGSVQVFVGKPFLSPVDRKERSVRFHAFNTIRFEHPCPPNSKTYYELLLLAGVEAPQFGFVSSKFERCRVELGRGVGDDAESWAVDGDRGAVWNNGQSEEYLGRWKEGDVIGLACDLEQRQLLVAVNGDSSPPNGVVFQLEEEAVQDGMYAAFVAGSGAVKFNFGEEQAMAHAWEGFEPLGRAVCTLP